VHGQFNKEREKNNEQVTFALLHWDSSATETCVSSSSAIFLHIAYLAWGTCSSRINTRCHCNAFGLSNGIFAGFSLLNCNKIKRCTQKSLACKQRLRVYSRAKFCCDRRIGGWAQRAKHYNFCRAVDYFWHRNKPSQIKLGI